MINTSTLVILAAGRGSRFGGAKQFVPFGPLQKTLMEYNIIQATKAGINHVVFITQASQQQTLQVQVIDKLPASIKATIVIQSAQTLPTGCAIHPDREKPLGTAHALWCAKDCLTEDFIVINADDYYGEQAFSIAQTMTKNEMGLVAFELRKTLSENGGVNRGFCHHDGESLQSIREVTNIIEKDEDHCLGDCDGAQIVIGKSQLVSMNFWRLSPKIFTTIEKQLTTLFSDKNKHSQQALTTEAYLPDSIFHYIANNKHQIKLLASQDAWFGVTYAADSPSVELALSTLSNNGAFDICA